MIINLRNANFSTVKIPPLSECRAQHGVNIRDNIFCHVGNFYNKFCGCRCKFSLIHRNIINSDLIVIHFHVKRIINLWLLIPFNTKKYSGVANAFVGMINGFGQTMNAKNLNEKSFHIKLPAYLEWILMTLSYHFAMCSGKSGLCRWWLLLGRREEKCLRDYFPINKLENPSWS